MKLETRHFGEIEINENEIIDFIGGVPGFNGTKYVLLNSLEEEVSPFMWLQSVEDGDVALVLINPFFLYPEYAPDINEEYIKELGYDTKDDLAVFNVLVIPENVEEMTVNLKAPIVVSNKTLKAMQVIADNTDYEIRHKVYEDFKKISEGVHGDK